MSSPAPDLSPPRRSRTRRNKAWNIVLAVFFFVLGFIGILIPVMPQFIFFALGILFLSFVSPPVRRRVRRFLHAHPKLAHQYKKWREKGRQKRRELIRRRKAMAEKLGLSGR